MYSSFHFNAKPRSTTAASKPEVLGKLKDIVGVDSVSVEIGLAELNDNSFDQAGDF